MNVLIFDGHIRNIENLKYDIYTTFTISTAVEVSLFDKPYGEFLWEKVHGSCPLEYGTCFTPHSQRNLHSLNM